LQDKLGVTKQRVYQLIDNRVRESHLPRRLAAIALAGDHHVNISRFASEEDLATIRGAQHAAPAGSPVLRGRDAAIARPSRNSRARTSQSADRKSVFVVHGRDEEARRELFVFLRALDLNPLEWNTLIRETRKGSPSVEDIVQTAFRRATATVVLFTPDEEVRLRTKHRSSQDSAQERGFKRQARPNVLFEAGMAFGSFSSRTVLVQLGKLRPFSDLAGRHIVLLDNTAQKRRELATKLKNAGCKVDESGTDWLSAGDLRTRR